MPVYLVLGIFFLINSNCSASICIFINCRHYYLMVHHFTGWPFSILPHSWYRVSESHSNALYPVPSSQRIIPSNTLLYIRNADERSAGRWVSSTFINSTRCVSMFVSVCLCVRLRLCVCECVYVQRCLWDAHFIPLNHTFLMLLCFVHSYIVPFYYYLLRTLSRSYFHAHRYVMRIESSSIYVAFFFSFSFFCLSRKKEFYLI